MVFLSPNNLLFSGSKPTPNTETVVFLTRLLPCLALLSQLVQYRFDKGSVTRQDWRHQAMGLKFSR